MYLLAHLLTDTYVPSIKSHHKYMFGLVRIFVPVSHTNDWRGRGINEDWRMCPAAMYVVHCTAMPFPHSKSFLCMLLCKWMETFFPALADSMQMLRFGGKKSLEQELLRRQRKATTTPQKCIHFTPNRFCSCCLCIASTTMKISWNHVNKISIVVISPAKKSQHNLIKGDQHHFPIVSARFYAFPFDHQFCKCTLRWRVIVVIDMLFIFQQSIGQAF